MNFSGLFFFLILIFIQNGKEGFERIKEKTILPFIKESDNKQIMHANR